MKTNLSLMFETKANKESKNDFYVFGVQQNRSRQTGRNTNLRDVDERFRRTGVGKEVLFEWK